MNIYNYIKNDHRRVSSLMEELLNTEEKSEREDLFSQIKEELTLHAKAEEATFYAALENKEKTHIDIEHAKEEHHEIKQYLYRLSKILIDTAEWTRIFKAFKEAVEYHIHEEENEIFPRAQKILSDKDADTLAEQMDDIKKMTIIPPRKLYGGFSRVTIN